MSEDKKSTTGIIEGTLVYAKIAQADEKYQSKDTEYSIGIIVDEDTADEWEAKFAKQPARKIKAAEFESRFKFPLPEALEGEKNVYQITLKKDAVVDGEEVFPDFRPRVFLDTEDERLDITESRLIANGSYGQVSYRFNTNKFGTFARLSNVRIKEEDFKEYVSQGGPAGSEFGDEKPVKKEAPKASVTKARPAKAEKAEDKEDADVAEPAKEAPAEKPKKAPKASASKEAPAEKSVPKDAPF